MSSGSEDEDEEYLSLAAVPSHSSDDDSLLDYSDVELELDVSIARALDDLQQLQDQVIHSKIW